ncbi:hypothetical protein Fmac_013175 [Flemingia macrophylla]|uniref:Uncharacterized protein n=1 Tax=Flemingia macrophylla TaxID=520843 RepID=A0ABD1MSE2_9FABA
MTTLEFAKFLPNCKLQVIEGADRVFTDHQAELASVVLNFIKETLQLSKLNASSCCLCCSTTCLN